MDRDYRLVAISKKMSYFLQGGAFKDGKPHPPFRGIDLSVEFDALVRHLNDRIANVMPWEVMICIRNNNTRRFRVMVGPPPLGEASWKGLPYQALRVRAVQGHHNELTRKYTEQAILTNLYSFDEEFTAAKYLDGQYPRAVRHPELTDLWRRGFPAVLYHTCDLRSAESILKFGLVPGGYPKSTGRAHVYFNPTPP